MAANTQLALFDEDRRKLQLPSPKNIKASRTGSFVDNMKLPVHGWLRYSAGFSAQWAESVITEFNPTKGVLDPFAGSATTLLAAEACHVASTGFEPQPFVYEIARAKLSWNVEETVLLTIKNEIVSKAHKIVKETPVSENSLLRSCYTDDALACLESLKFSYEEYDWTIQHDHFQRLTWLAITSILRECSAAGTATWQYVLPNKRKRNPKHPFRAFDEKMTRMAGDISQFKRHSPNDNATIHCTDARNPVEVEPRQFDLVITSPPYPNNYDYADATRLEMTFWGIVETWGELHEAARRYLLRSCSQHTAKDRLKLTDLLENNIIDPIRDELTDVCHQLEKVREHKRGKKTYHTMIAAYFVDLARIFRGLRNLCAPDSTLCFVIGDSAPYGVYVPTDEWLGELAVAYGFKHYRFEQIRTRNTKWKNRKHRVPLKEGNLWITG